ncbi:hypothetical protein [Streptomyces sp.]|uniref:hypothetical protein n=1 Tax=Streptomyces sp. TaxID=1931 RepID=UPI002F3F4A27
MVDDAFEDIIGRLIVDGWHGAWRAARIKLTTHARGDDFATARDIGTEAWNSTPQDDRPAALGALFDAYFKAGMDQAIRNSIEADPDLGEDFAVLRAAIDAVRQTSARMAMVDVQSLARVLAELESAHLHRRWCPQLAEGDEKEGCQ